MGVGKWDVFRAQEVKLRRRVGAFHFLVRIYTAWDTKESWNHILAGFTFLGENPNHWKTLEIFDRNMIKWDRGRINVGLIEAYRMNCRNGKMIMSRTGKGLRFHSTCKLTN